MKNIHALLYALYFQVLKVYFCLTKICKIEPPDPLFIFIFHKILELKSTLSGKKVFVMNFPFLTNSLTHPLKTAKKFFVDAP